jgi:hypothetical protein
MKHVILPSFVHQTGREAHDLHAVANQQSVVRRHTQVELVGGGCGLQASHRERIYDLPKSSQSKLEQRAD